jgi:hypothetical protein
MESGAFFLFLAVGAAALFSFISVAVWAGTRYAEREKYYNNELVKKAMEAPTTAGLDYLRERDREATRQQARKARSGLRLGGLCAVAVGIGLMVALHEIAVHETGGERNAYLLGLIPLLVGAVLFGYSFFSPQE